MALAHLGLTFIKRVRCLCFDIKPVGGPKIQISDYMDFLIEDCKIDPVDIECQGYHTMTNHLMVTLSTEEVFKEKLALVEKGVSWTKKGGKLVYGFSAQEYLTSVTIQNWRPWMEVDPILEQMSKFGDVITWNYVETPGFPNILQNQLKLRMKLKPGCVLPPDLGRSVSDIGERLSIFWEGSERRCFKCQGVGHSIAFCRQKAIDYDTTPSQNTWAVVASRKPVSKGRQPVAIKVTAKSTAAPASKDLPPPAVQSTSGKKSVHGATGRPLPNMSNCFAPLIQDSQDKLEKKKAVKADKIAAKAAKAAKAAQAAKDAQAAQVVMDGQDVSQGAEQMSDQDSEDEHDMETGGLKGSRDLFLDSPSSQPSIHDEGDSQRISEFNSDFSLPCNQLALYPDGLSPWSDQDPESGRKRGLSVGAGVRNTKPKNN